MESDWDHQLLTYRLHCCGCRYASSLSTTVKEKMGLHWRWLHMNPTYSSFCNRPECTCTELQSLSAVQRAGAWLILALALLAVCECALGCSNFEVEWVSLNLHGRNSSEHSWTERGAVQVSSATLAVTRLTGLIWLSCLNWVSFVYEGWETQT